MYYILYKRYVMLYRTCAIYSNTNILPFDAYDKYLWNIIINCY